MIPEGRYRARATDGALGESSTGNAQIAVRFAFLDEDYAGQTITWYGSFSKTLGKGSKTPLQRTIEALRVCGWRGDDLSQLIGITDNEVELIVEHTVYKGEVRAEVKWINRPQSALTLKAPMNAETAKAFAAKMRGEVIAASRTVATPKDPPKAPRKDETPTGTEDEIPF